MKKICILIPVLEEEKNILKIYNKLNILKFKFDLLFIDDNSKDNTRQKILYLKKKNKNVNFIFRDKKKGIGSAHKDAIKWCYQRKYSTIVTMDCDGTHDPKYIPNLLNKSKYYDMVITSRFKKKNSLKDWPIHRKFLTTSRLYLTKMILNMHHDTSGAFRCFKTSKINLTDILSVESNNYDFFLKVFIICLKKITLFMKFQ